MNIKSENNLTDQQLVKKITSGDTNAFSIVINQTERLVAQIIYKMVQDAEDRKDVAQEVYLKAFNALSGFNFHSKLSTWIAQITYNTCLNYLRKKRVELIPDFEDIQHQEMTMEYLAHKVTDSAVNAVEESINQRELAGILSEEIEKLPPLYKTLITLFHNEGMSYSEIGEITALPEGTLKNYLYRARKSMKESILRKYNREAL